MAKEKQVSIPQILNSAGKLFEERNDQYGSCYERHGKILNVLFPNGIKLKGEKEMSIFSHFNAVLGKLNRAAINIDKGEFHFDSFEDAIVYLAMAIQRENKGK